MGILERLGNGYKGVFGAEYKGEPCTPPNRNNLDQVPRNAHNRYLEIRQQTKEAAQKIKDQPL